MVDLSSLNVIINIFFVMKDEEERELATIFLQQVIRGRAIQNMVRKSVIVH